MSQLSEMKISYIENGTFKPNVSNIEDQTGYHLYCDGFVFRKKKTNKDGSKYWICRHEKCKSTIIVKNEIVIRFTPHEMPGDWQLIYRGGPGSRAASHEVERAWLGSDVVS